MIFSLPFFPLFIVFTLWTIPWKIKPASLWINFKKDYDFKLSQSHHLLPLKPFFPYTQNWSTFSFIGRNKMEWTFWTKRKPDFPNSAGFEKHAKVNKIEITKEHIGVYPWVDCVFATHINTFIIVPQHFISIKILIYILNCLVCYYFIYKKKIKRMEHLKPRLTTVESHN